MGNYSIRDLEKLSGIKAHTLRIWEQRYNLLKPDRSDTNIRNYNTEDLKLILNVALLKDHGFKISKIAKYDPKKIQKEVLAISDKQLNYPDQIQALTSAMLELNEERFEHLINLNVEKFGFESVMMNIIYPFLTRIGTLWVTGSIGPALEHFMTNLIRQKLIVAIETLPKQLKDNHKTFLLYLPEGEYHEIGLLFANYLIKSRKHKVVYLGQTLPKSDVVFVQKQYQADFVFCSITSTPGADHLQAYIDWLGGTFPTSKVLLTGYQVLNCEVTLPSNCSIIQNVTDLQKLLDWI